MNRVRPELILPLFLGMVEGEYSNQIGRIRQDDSTDEPNYRTLSFDFVRQRRSRPGIRYEHHEMRIPMDATREQVERCLCQLNDLPINVSIKPDIPQEAPHED